MTTTSRPAMEQTPRSALSARTRSHPSMLSATVTLGWRALVKIKHNPEQLFSAIGMPIMFILVFTYLFGGALGGSPRDYLQFFAPGIIVVSVVMLTMYTGVALNTDVAKGVFDRFRSLSFWRPAVVVGFLLGDAIRYTVASAIAVALSLALGFRPGGGVVGVVLALLLVQLFGFSMAWIWTALGLVMRTPEAVMNVSSMAMFPLVFASNIIVPPETMPGWLREAVEANPISVVVTAVRGLMHGTATVGHIGWALFACGALIGVFGTITMYLYARKR